MAVPNIFTAGTLAKSSEVNENFTYVETYPFAGDGSDGALSVTSGTTNLNLGTVYQYSSITISSGATLSTTDSANYGKPMILYCKGDCTIEGTISLNGKGYPANTGYESDSLSTGNSGGGGGSAVNDGANGGGTKGVKLQRFYDYAKFSGAGGSTTSAGAGGAGGAGLILVVGGNLIISGTINLSGTNGASGGYFNTICSSGYGGAGGGGSGCGLIVYIGTLTNTGTLTSNGGSGGGGGSGPCGSSAAGGAGGDGEINVITLKELNIGKALI